MRPVARFLAGLLAALLGAAIVVMGGLAFVLSQGPIPLDRLKPWIDSRLASSVRGFEIRFGEPSLVWSPETRSVALRVTDVKVRSAEGQRLLAVPELLVDLDLSEIIRTGRLAIEEISVDGPRVRIVREPDGSYDFGQQEGDGEGAGKLILARLLAPADRDRPLPVQRIVVRGAEVILIDAEARRRIVAVRGQLGLTHDSVGEPEIRGEFAVAGGLVSILLKPRADGVVVAEALIRGIQPTTVITTDDAELALFLGRRFSGSFQAIIQDVMTSRPRFEVQLGAGMLTLDGRLTETLGVPRLTAQGTLDLERRAVEARSLTVEVTPVVAQGHAELTFGDGLQLTGALAGGAATLPDVLAWWPDELAPGTKRWIAEHVAAARASDATFEFSWSSTEPDARWLGIQFNVVDGEVAFLNDFPPAMGIQGTGRFDLHSFGFDLTGGSLGGLAADKARLDIQLRKPGPALLATRVAMAGPVPEALRIVASLPRELNPHLPVEPKDTSGSGTYLVDLSLPIQKEIPREAASFKVTADIVDGAAVLFDGALQLARAAITLDVTDEDLEGRGTLLVNGIDSRLVPIAKPPGARGALRLRGEADRSGLSAAGLPVLPWLEGGTVGLDLAVVLREKRPLELELAADLAGASIVVPGLAFAKPPGVSGRLELAAVPRTNVVEIPRLELEAGDLHALASASIAPEDRTARFEISRFSLGETELTGVLEHTRTGPWRADLHATTVDLRRWLHLERPGPNLLAASMGASFALDLHILAEQARLPGGSLDDLDLTLSRSEERWERMEARAGLNDAQKARASLQPAGDGTHAFELVTDDAGGLLSALDPAATYPEGGTLRFEGKLQSQEPLDFRGRIVVRSFMVRGAPVLAKILTLASLTGIENTLQGQGIHFERARADLAFRNGTLTISDGRAHGSEVGITSSGKIDFDAGEIALSGTVVPFYTLNHILAQVPILGNLLAGREQMGAFAATYSIAGRLASPAFAVNPLSVIVPGFVRDLFSDAASSDRPFEVQTEVGRRPD